MRQKGYHGLSRALRKFRPEKQMQPIYERSAFRPTRRKTVGRHEMKEENCLQRASDDWTWRRAAGDRKKSKKGEYSQTLRRLRTRIAFQHSSSSWRVITPPGPPPPPPVCPCDRRRRARGRRGQNRALLNGVLQVVAIRVRRIQERNSSNLFASY